MAASQNVILLANKSDTTPLFSEKAHINNTVDGINKLVYVNQAVVLEEFAWKIHTITFKAIETISNTEPKSFGKGAFGVSDNLSVK